MVAGGLPVRPVGQEVTDDVFRFRVSNENQSHTDLCS
jgi:hypothetical protein